MNVILFGAVNSMAKNDPNYFKTETSMFELRKENTRTFKEIYIFLVNNHIILNIWGKVQNKLKFTNCFLV